MSRFNWFFLREDFMSASTLQRVIPCKARKRSALLELKAFVGAWSAVTRTADGAYISHYFAWPSGVRYGMVRLAQDAFASLRVIGHLERAIKTVVNLRRQRATFSLLSAST
jgi:hypothetical protein